MLQIKKMTVLFILFLTVIFLFPQLVSAQDAYGINDFASGGVNLGTRDLRETISGVVNIALGFLGILATLIILYGGYVWMTAAGAPDKIEKAKKIIINGVIGLIIILSSYAIARFFLREGSGIFSGSGGGGGPTGYSGGSGLSGGVLQDHYPARDARDVARNTNIYVTFKEDMELASILEDDTCTIDCNAMPGLIELYEDGSPIPITGGNLLVTYDPSNPRVFQFNPYGSTGTVLGLDTNDVKYRMDLGDIETATGERAFPLTGGYSWNFTVSTDIDTTPPRVLSVRPVPLSLDNPRNRVIKINFSEAVNPIFAIGVVDGIPLDFENISTNYPGVGGANRVKGEYLISNQYKTVEFLTDDLCGQNSCGGDVYCLPGGQDIGTRVLPVIEDMATNKLDQDDDGVGGEDPEDRYEWSFTTNNLIDLNPPDISAMEPINNVSLRDSINIRFSKELLSSSINSSNISLEDASGPVNYWLDLVGGNTIRIKHDIFDALSVYSPTLTSGIKDEFQNCWYICECSADPGKTCYCQNNTVGTDCPSGSGTNCASDL